MFLGLGSSWYPARIDLELKCFVSVPSVLLSPWGWSCKPTAPQTAEVWVAQRQTPVADFKSCCGSILPVGQGHPHRADLSPCQTTGLRAHLIKTLAFLQVGVFSFVKWGSLASSSPVWLRASSGSSWMWSNQISSGILRWRAPAEHQGWFILLVPWLWAHVHPQTFLQSRLFLSFLSP